MDPKRTVTYVMAGIEIRTALPSPVENDLVDFCPEIF